MCCMRALLFSNAYWDEISFFILQRDIVSSYLDSGRPADELGVEDAFEVLHEMNERVRTGIWVGDCFIYNNSSWRLNYCVGGEVLHNSSFGIFFPTKNLFTLLNLITTSMFYAGFLILGNHNVPLGPAYVFVGVSCKPKSGVSDWQRVQVSMASVLWLKGYGSNLHCLVIYAFSSPFPPHYCAVS